MFPQPAQFTDLSLLRLRLLVAAIFVTSGFEPPPRPEGPRAEHRPEPGLHNLPGRGGTCRRAGSTFGVLTQLAATGLILVRQGAIQRKIFVWHTGFWGEKASGWHDDLILFLMNLVIICIDGGRYVLWT